MEFVKLSADDLSRIKKLFTAVFTREPWKDDWSDEAQLDQYLIDLIGCPNSLTLAFAEGEELIALAMGRVKHWYQGTEYYIDELCVKTEKQGQGIGGRFVSEIEAYLKRNGITGIFLLTDRDVPAYAFYQKQGFDEHGNLAAFGKWL